MFDKHHIGLDITSFSDNKKRLPVSRITFLLDDENVITAGDDTGLEIEADCPFATQEMADNLLAKLKGYQYHAYSAGDAGIDPAAELGDGVNVAGIYGVLSQINDDGRRYPNISAPGALELEEEYPSAGPMTREFNRKIAQTRSYIYKTAEEIRIGVANDIENIRSEVDIKVNEISLTVQGLEGNVSKIQQFADSLTLSVDNYSTSSMIYLTAGEISLASAQIKMDGLVTFSSLANGTTTIDGSCIKTGKISADHINLSGYISFGDFDPDTQASLEAVGDWRYGDTTYIDGSMIKTGTVIADSLRGGDLYLYDSDGNRVGKIGVGSESSSEFGDRPVVSFKAGPDGEGAGIECVGNWLDLENVWSVNVYVEGNLIPNQHGDAGRGTFSLGTDVSPWLELWSTGGPWLLSDLNKKTNVDYNISKYNSFFDSLKPISYKMKSGTSGRTHIGMGAQDVEAAVVNAGMTGLDFAGYAKYTNEDGEPGYSLRYDEFIGLLIDQVQKLKKRVAKIEGGIDDGRP